MKLYSLETIDEQEIEKELIHLQEQKQIMIESLEEVRSLKGGLTVKEEVNQSDHKVRKQVIFEEIWIYPKKEIRGIDF